MSERIRVSPEVAHTLAAGGPVVALESTLLAHGLPALDNRAVADSLQAAVRAAGAVPATVAVLDGLVHVGLDADGLDRVCAGGLAKLSRRDLGPAAASGRDGATTVAATVAVAHRAGIEVFATGGIGGVHRGARDSWDISADLAALADTPVLVVCSGVKSILDVPATLERLETLSVPVLGFGTDGFAGFYRRGSGCPVPWRVDRVPDIAEAVLAHRALGARSGVVLANPVPASHELDAALHDRVLADGLEDVARRGLTGKAVTPALLDHFRAATGGASLACNIALVTANAELAAQVAAALATPRSR